MPPMKRPSSTSCTLRAGASVSRPILSNIGVLRPIYPAGGLSRRRGSKTAPTRIAGRGQHRDEASVPRLARPRVLVRTVLRRRNHVVLHRQTVVAGKRVSVRVDIGGRPAIKKKKQH